MTHKIIITLFIFAVGCLVVQPTFAADEVTTKGTLNVRSGPGLTYDVIDTLREATTLTVIEEQDEWYHVSYKGSKGWVASWLVDRVHKSEGARVVSTTDGLNVRLGPSTKSNVIGRMDAGKEATVTLVRDDWAYIVVDGMNGWVHTMYLSDLSEETARENEKQTEATERTDQFTVQVDALHVRSKPGLRGKILAYAKRDETFPVLDVEHNWVRIQFDDDTTGWVARFHGELSSSKHGVDSEYGLFTITTVAGGTNLRAKPTTHSEVVQRVAAGKQFNVLREEGDWYEVEIDGETAYIAQWVVQKMNTSSKRERSTERKKASIPGTLNGISIVLDPGHGGHDRGTTGARGTREKDLTLQTADVLALKLRAAGATVHFTRDRDEFVPLRTRAQLKDQLGADAFISIHYDANLDASIQGHTTFYYGAEQQQLAERVHASITDAVPLRDRGVQIGDFLVLRENSEDAILIELGFLTNASEEQVLLSSQFRENVTYGIYNALLQYFNEP